MSLSDWLKSMKTKSAKRGKPNLDPPVPRIGRLLKAPCNFKKILSQKLQKRAFVNRNLWVHYWEESFGVNRFLEASTQNPLKKLRRRFIEIHLFRWPPFDLTPHTQRPSFRIGQKPRLDLMDGKMLPEAVPEVGRDKVANVFASGRNFLVDRIIIRQFNAIRR